MKETKDFASLLFQLNSTEFTLLATALGYLLSYPLTIDEQNSLGNFLELTGQIILTFNAQNQLLQDRRLAQNQMTNVDLSRKIDLLERRIEELTNKLK